MTSVAGQVREYLAAHPTMLAALRSGVANNSAVSRRIAQELGLRRSEAVLAACRRFPRDPAERRSERNVQRLLSRSRIVTRSHVATVTISAGVEELRTLADAVAGLLREDELVRLVQGARTVVVVLDENNVDRVTKKLRPAQVLGIKRGLSEVTVAGPQELDRTPGVIALLTNALAVQGVNILQGLLFPIDMTFIVENSDLGTTVQALSRLLHSAT